MTVMARLLLSSSLSPFQIIIRRNIRGHPESTSRSGGWGGGVRVSLTTRYMGWGVLSIVTFVIKTVFCSSRCQYQTESIDLYASFGNVDISR